MTVITFLPMASKQNSRVSVWKFILFFKYKIEACLGPIFSVMMNSENLIFRNKIATKHFCKSVHFL